jgi:hypothetical protein
MVFQWACGTWSINRCPRGQRPRSVPCWSRSRSRRETPVGLDQTCLALASSAAVRALRSRALAPLPADFFASSRDRVGDFPTNFDELSAGFSCCRCGHVGNALALSIMSTAWPRMRDGSVGEALLCALVIWIAQVQARLRRRYSIGDIIGPSDLNSPTRFHEDPFFEADLVALKGAPHRAATASDPSLVHRPQRFHQASGQVAEQSAQTKRPRAPPAGRWCPRSAWEHSFPSPADAASI